MKTLIELADRAVLPDSLIRFGIRQLDKKRLREEGRAFDEDPQLKSERFIEMMRRSPIAEKPHRANEQHYEVPPDFFKLVLGKHLKYSSCYWQEGVDHLDEAEARMLTLTGQRAELGNGLNILELGCGWGSLSLWMAQSYPGSRILAVSNSKQQGAFIRGRARDRGLENLQVITADMNDFSIDRQFDRIVSVEMFEHMRNWPALLKRVGNWLTPDGKMFIHIFTHRKYAYTFDELGDDDWMGSHFFSGGMMPSDDLLFKLQDHLAVETHWRINGKHYSRTAEAWLKNMDTHREEIMPIMENVYGRRQSARWFQRWRIFFMACAELWGFGDGREWLVSHYLLKHRE